MLGHIGVNVPDLGQARAYYEPLMPLLGYEPSPTGDDAMAFMPAAASGAPTSSSTRRRSDRPTHASATGLQHLAFIIPTRSSVADVHAHVSQAGSTVLHPPREWPQYPPPYFATFWLDPFGLMLEAVCHHDRD